MNRMQLLNQVGESEEFYRFQEDLRKAASVDRSVLLIGERGSGKEFAASRLHYLSSRWKNSFIKLNCAALPPSLIETELFGHVKGAYTGADTERRGRFEEADNGTLFLDEIGLIPFEVQEKILRVVEYGTFERVGSSETIEADVKIIGAANQDLPALCREGKFKQDLLDRLSFEVLFVPPLRERKGDIMVLSENFALNMGRELGKKGRISFTAEVIEKLNTYSWPGNIRELKNTVERAVYRTEGNIIDKITINPFINPYSEADKQEDFEEYPDEDYLKSGSLPDEERRDNVKSRMIWKLIKTLTEEAEKEYNNDNSKTSVSSADFRKIVDIVKRELLVSALKDSDNNQKAAAGILNLTYDQFRGAYRKYFN